MRFRELALVAVLVTGTSTGCGAPADEANMGPPAGVAGALTQDEVDEALLTVDHLSAEFEIDTEEDDDDEGPDWGCLDFDRLAQEAPSSDDGPQGEITFRAIEEPGMPGVFQALTGAPDADTAEEALDKFVTVMDGCTRVDSTDDDGTHWQFDIATDEDVWADGADQQVNMTATGSIGLSGLSVPIDIRLSFLRLGSVVCMVGFFDMTEDAGTAPHELVVVAALRLHAVLAGEAPPEAEPVFDGYPIGGAFDALVLGQTA